MPNLNCTIYEISKLSHEAVPILGGLFAAPEIADNQNLRILLRLFQNMQKFSMKAIRSFNFAHDDMEFKTNTAIIYNCAAEMGDAMTRLKSTIDLSKPQKLVEQLEYRVARTVELLAQLTEVVREMYGEADALAIVDQRFHKYLKPPGDKDKSEKVSQ